jgi:molybdate/tungstate transport system substrate-binding protein
MRRSRRALLAGAASTLASAGLAGCIGPTTGEDPVRVLAAGSLQHAFDGALRDAVDAEFALEARGSAAAARLVADGTRDPDVLALADTALFDRVLNDVWHAAVATNAVAVATADTDGGRAVQAAAERDDVHWFDPLLDGAATLGRTDPDLDPLGYRTLFALELAAAHYDRRGLREALTAPDQVYPETALLSGFETGALDAAVVYETMADERGYDAVDLPPVVDLSSPAHADRYRAQSYALDDGVVVRGSVVEYGATLRSADDDAASRVFDAIVDGDALGAHGFAVPDDYPTFTADAPPSATDDRARSPDG